MLSEERRTHDSRLFTVEQYMALKLLVGNSVVEHYVHHICTLPQKTEAAGSGELK